MAGIGRQSDLGSAQRRELTSPTWLPGQDNGARSSQPTNCRLFVSALREADARAANRVLVLYCSREARDSPTTGRR
jgi:hypothetical protein